MLSQNAEFRDMPSSDLSLKHQKIIFAGLKLIYENGYHAASINNIVKAAGIPKGSFYYYFSTKEEFLVQTLEFFSAHRVAAYEAAFADSSYSPVSRVIRFFESFPDRLTDLERLSIKFFFKIAQELRSSHPEIAGIIDDYYAGFRRALASCIAEGQRTGEIAAGKDSAELASFLFFAWRGTLLNTDLSDDTGPIKLFCKIVERDILT